MFSSFYLFFLEVFFVSDADIDIIVKKKTKKKKHVVS